MRIFINEYKTQSNIYRNKQMEKFILNHFHDIEYLSNSDENKDNVFSIITIYFKFDSLSKPSSIEFELTYSKSENTITNVFWYRDSGYIDPSISIYFNTLKWKSISEFMNFMNELFVLKGKKEIF